MILRLYKIFLSISEITNLIYLLITTILSPIYQAIKPKRIKSVKNQLVLITGSGNGIGRELALRFAELDAITILWDINETTVQKTCETINEMGKKSYWFCVDVSDENQVANAANQVRTQIGDIDILINNAGIAPCEPFKKLTNDKIREVFNVNILGHFWTVHQFLPIMEKNNSGHIVAIASSAGIMGSPYFTAYGASKHAVVGFMKCLYEEMDENSKIKLTTICPLGISGTGIDIPTKTRFPFLLPIMAIDYAVDKIFNAILKEEDFVVLPFTFKWIHRILSIFPQNISSRIWKCLDYEVVPTGLYAPIGRAHYYDRINRKLSTAKMNGNMTHHHSGTPSRSNSFSRYIR